MQAAWFDGPASPQCLKARSFVCEILCRMDHFQHPIRLVNGTIAIESKPMHGTTVHVRVPLESEHRSELAG
jgi:hypothetical protein